jgi:hypothetical protein
MTDTGARESPDEVVFVPEANPFSLLPYQSERFPFWASILWTPRNSWVIDERMVPRPDIVIDQRVFRAIDTLRSAHPAGEAAGVLIGRLCECPWTRRHWVHAMTVCGETLSTHMRYDHEEDAREEIGRGRVVEDAVMAAFRRSDRGDTLPVGWFRTRQGSACSLTRPEADFHARHFTEQWQFGLLILFSPTESRPRRGMVFVADDRGEVTARNWSFYEHLDGITDPGSGPLRSWVGWQGYATDRPTVSAHGQKRAPRKRHLSLRRAPVQPPTPRRRGHRRGVTLLAVSAFLATTIWLVSSRERSGSAHASPALTVDGPGRFASPTVAAVPEALQKFTRASRDYFDVSRAFLAQEVGCAPLEVAYRSAYDAFDSLGSELASGPRRDRGLASFDGAVAETIRDIEASFTRSGCGP